MGLLPEASGGEPSHTDSKRKSKRPCEPPGDFPIGGGESHGAIPDFAASSSRYPRGIDFSHFTIELPRRSTTKLAKSPTWRVLLPGVTNQKTLKAGSSKCQQVIHVQQNADDRRRLGGGGILKIHRHHGHCSEQQLAGLLKFGGCRVDSRQIQRVAEKRKRRRSAHRITPPAVSRWIARLSGEMVAIDLIRPFADS